MIAYTMLYAAVAAVPVLLAAALEAAFLRTHGRAERWVWAAALLIALVLPLAVLTPPQAPLPAAETPVISEITSELQPVLVLPAASASGGSDLDPSAVMLALWLAASAVLVARWSISWMKLRRQRRTWTGQQVDGVPVSVSTDVGPGLFGLWRPRIVIPSWVANLPADQRAFVLRHEQEHLRGRDHWLNALIRASRVLAPWNPVVWLLSSRLGRAVELDCDRRVLRADPNVAGYGATLLMISERRSSGVVPALAFAASELPLRERILAMTAPQRSLSAVGLGAALVVGVVLLGTALRVPVPAVGMPTVRLSQVLVAAPEKTAAPHAVLADAGEVEARMAQAGPAPAQQSSRPHQLAAQQTLPGVHLITDMNRAFFLAPDRQRGLPQRRLGYGIIGDGVRLLIPPGGEAARYVDDDRLVLFDFTTAVGNSIAPIVPPFPGGPPREITELPRILNADEVIAAIAAEYPADLRARGLGGTVGMQFLIGEAGEVRNIRVSAIAAYDALTAAAGRVAQVYRFSPGRAGDEYVTLWVTHAIDFRVP